MESDVAIGVDLGTAGVRALAVDGAGDVLAVHREAFPPSSVQDRRHEQDAESWWATGCQAMAGVVAKLADAGIGPDRLAAVAVDGTSGTIVLLDGNGDPLGPGLMYNDGRSTAEAEALNELAETFCNRHGYRFAASFAIAKIEWLRRHEATLFASTKYIAHQADFIAGRLIEKLGVSDYSNALKTGYDLLDEKWPDWIDELPGVRERLPTVTAPGSRLGEVTATASAATGLPAGLPVIAGASDGTAGCIASGISQAGDCSSTLGTTLVFKTLSANLAKDPDGLIYSHKLPGGLWLPGAASNVGCEWIGSWFTDDDPSALDVTARDLLPVDIPCYPLARTGERFPFLAAAAVAAGVPDHTDPVTRYAACLQGTACVERLAFEVLDSVTGESGTAVYTTGGGSRSDIWTQLRADITGRTYHRPQCAESAFGSAILAAAGATSRSVQQTTAQLVKIERSFEPDAGDLYEGLFEDFRSLLHGQGYLC
jgi:sugar (pentulose or hexulose) kinase